MLSRNKTYYNFIQNRLSESRRGENFFSALSHFHPSHHHLPPLPSFTHLFHHWRRTRHDHSISASHFSCFSSYPEAVKVTIVSLLPVLSDLARSGIQAELTEHSKAYWWRSTEIHNSTFLRKKPFLSKTKSLNEDKQVDLSDANIVLKLALGIGDWNG